MPIERCTLGVSGLDQCIEGGLLRGSSNLVAGGPGSGKSILCMQFLVDGAVKGENGMYVSFEEDETQMAQNFSPFGWELDKLVKGGKIMLKYFSPEHVATYLKAPVDPLLDTVRQYNVKRIVIDSASGYEILFDSDYSRRVGLLKLLESLKKYGATILITSERDLSTEAPNFIEFLVNGAIVLYNTRQGSQRGRGIEVLKMRATNHTQKIMPMKIDKKGITVYPDELFFQA
ncbi:MAG: AAA family ATPase [Candidatus Aenigmatarchaeota archaeon]|nr:MAG: AAA family ATPase [Candidatus Aenigmarchaeota archaeon]